MYPGIYARQNLGARKPFPGDIAELIYPIPGKGTFWGNDLPH